MKQVLMLAAAAVLAACAGGAPEPDYWTASRSGGAAQASGQQPAGPGQGHRAAALAQLDRMSSVKPGLYTTRTGAPWLVFRSASLQEGRGPLAAAAAAQAAMGYQSSRHKAPYAAPVAAGGSRARFRLVTVDGRDHAVLLRIKLPAAAHGGGEQAALRPLAARAAELAGCRIAGGATLRTASGAVTALAAPAAC